MKRMLFIEPWFPPFGGMFGLRSLKFVKYLPEYGWEPVVLALAGGDYLYHDPTLLEELPKKIKVCRAFGIQPAKLYRKLRLFAHKINGNGIERCNTIKLPAEGKPAGASGYIKNFVAKHFLIPDEYIGWLPFAAISGLQLMKRYDIDVIFTTSGAETSHLVGLALKKFSSKPWVADFRDWWTSYRDDSFRSSFSGHLEKSMEAAVMKSVDRVTVATPFIGNLFTDKYSFLDPGKVTTITNGFDPDDFKELTKSNGNGKFTLTYTGSVYPFGGIRPFFKALATLPETVKKDLKVNIVGGMHDEDNKQIGQMNLHSMVFTHKFMPHRQAIEFMMSANVLLLLVASFPGCEGMYTGKIFDYLGARKPILALAVDSHATGLIRKLNAGIVVHPADTENIRKQIIALYDKHKNGTLGTLCHNADIKQFERKELTGQLAGVLDEALARGN